MTNFHHLASRVAAYARAKEPNREKLNEARQDLQEARLGATIDDLAFAGGDQTVWLDEDRRRRLAEALYPEGLI